MARTTHQTSATLSPKPGPDSFGGKDSIEGKGQGAATEAPIGDATSAAPVTRACPTRIDGMVPLFQHKVTVPQCQSKQRKLYHKCFTCAHAAHRS